MVIVTWERDPRAVRPYTGGQVWGSGRLPWGASPDRRKKQPEGWWALARWGGWEEGPGRGGGLFRAPAEGGSWPAGVSRWAEGELGAKEADVQKVGATHGKGPRQCWVGQSALPA